ncbi:MAG TPA: alpha/beta hydrolase [Roseiflexaceae bacterium]|nr:alpha/beta hydrolase [Roseiflexaceae bacterium]
MTTTLSPRAIPAARRASALYCASNGGGTPLLLVHGLGVSGAVFDPLVPTLSARYQTLTPDLRGHGQSRRLPSPDNIERLAADLENLLDILGISSCYALGYASGGAVVQQLARRQPQRLRGVALVCAQAHSTGSIREQIERRLRPELFRLLGGSGMGRLAAHTGCPRGTPPEAYDFVRETMATNDGRRVAPVARSLQGFDSRSWLHEITCPALVVGGAADPTTPAHHAHELAAGLPHAELHMIPGAGHWLVKTHTQALLDLLTGWLERQEARA